MARNYDAELLLVRVVASPRDGGTDHDDGDSAQIAALGAQLENQATELSGGHGQGLAVIDDDPASALVRVAAEQAADVLVVGNAGMAGRKQFLLGNVPNRVSHQARCTVAIVNTVQTDADDRHAAGRSRTAGAASKDGAATLLTPRALQIARVLRRAGFLDLLAGRHGEDEDDRHRRARDLRDGFEELGPTFCKVGQVLSTRPDLLPPAYAEELASLQDRVPPMAESEVVTVMEAELAIPWEDVFDSIDPMPLAAGTIAQVHRATLSTGERVVVKVQRPTARDEIERDLELLRRFARTAQSSAAIRSVIDIGALHTELSASLQRELDFREEADSLRRLRDAVQCHPRLGVPRIHDEYCTQRLLVMEEIPGVPVRDAPPGTARREAARQLTTSFYEQILSHGFFHADPHPGNLMWWQDRLYFLDGGMVGRVSAQLRDALLLLLVAFWHEDADSLADVALLLAGEDVPLDLDIARFRERIGAMVSRYRHLPVGRLELGAIMQEMSGIAVEHGVALPATLVLVAKALAQVQLSAAVLDPDLDPFAAAGSFLARTALRRAGAVASPQRVLYEAEKLRLRGARIVEALERVTGARPGHPLQVQFRGTGGLEARIRTASRRIALSLVMVGLFITLAIAATASNRPPGWLLGLIAALAAIFSVAFLVALLVPEDREVVHHGTG